MNSLTKGRLMVEAFPWGPRGPGFRQWRADASIDGQVVESADGKDEASALRFLAYQLFEDLAKQEYWGTSLDEQAE